MNQVKNLILLDLRRLMSMRVIFTLYTVMMLVFAAIGNGRASMLSNLGFIIFLYLWVYGPSGYGGETLSGILPVGRSQVVLARYLYSILGIACSVGAIWIIRLAVSRGTVVLSTALLFCAGCIFTAIVTPPLLYFGATKARYFVMGIYVIGIAGTGAFNGIVSQADDLPTVTPGISLIIVSLALMAVSYIICLKLFARREFTD